MTLVLDCSQFAGIPDFRPLRDRGAEGIIVRGSSGPTHADTLARAQLDAAIAVGLVPIAVYHYCYSWRDGAHQAAHAVAVAASLGLPVAADFERTASGPPRPSDEPAAARVTALAFLRHHRSLTGRRAVVYGPAFYLRDMRLEGDDVGPLWVAHAKVTAPLVPPPWTRAVLHQYQLDEEVDALGGGGPSAVVDWSRSDLTIEQLCAVFRGDDGLGFDTLGPALAGVRAAEGRGATVESLTSHDEGPTIG